MEPFWKLKYSIDLNTATEHHLSMYKYTDMHVALTCDTQEFIKAYGKYFKRLGGVYSDLIIIDDNKQEGWLYNSDALLLEKVMKLLKDIYNNKVEPFITDPVKEKLKNIKIFNLLQQLLDTITEDNEDYVLSKNDRVKTVMYYNRPDSRDVDGDLVYILEGGGKRMEIMQSPVT